jgi:hypothetical protein
MLSAVMWWDLIQHVGEVQTVWYNGCNCLLAVYYGSDKWRNVEHINTPIILFHLNLATHRRGGTASRGTSVRGSKFGNLPTTHNNQQPITWQCCGKLNDKIPPPPPLPALPVTPISTPYEYRNIISKSNPKTIFRYAAEAARWSFCVTPARMNQQNYSGWQRR